MNVSAARKSFLEALSSQILLGDGANGSMLQKAGFKKGMPELANLLAPELVLEVHRAYIAAGSDFLETNTYAANRFKIPDPTLDHYDLNLKGARLAREAAGDRYVVGAIGPAGAHLEPIGHLKEADVASSVESQAKALVEGGVDAIILETFVDMREIELSIQAVRRVTDLPIIVSKAFIEDGEALAEGLPGQCALKFAEWGVAAMGANCVVGPQRMVDIVRQIVEVSPVPVLAFPTPGLPQLVKGSVVYDTRPEYFGKASARLLEEGAKIIGGCCGTSPDHIRAIRAEIDRGIQKAQSAKPKSTAPKEVKPLAQAESTNLAALLGKKFVITVELDLPRGLNVQKVIDGARSLKAKGADLIDISDGARARLRMNPMSISKIIQDEVGIEVMMHFACRDRNLLAVQADLLGCHALGIRNILAVTGDPANIGDYPSATSVYDVDSIGLVRIMSRFNEGVDLAGNTVGLKCAFTIAAAYNPLAEDMVTENDRLKRKVDCGAHCVYTQPIFDPATVNEAAEACAKLGVPLLIGVLPLRSQRHAEFMHNEVPGIEVPDWLRKKFADAENDEIALKIGIEEAQKLASVLKGTVQGIYLMPPFGNPRIAEEVMEAVL